MSNPNRRLGVFSLVAAVPILFTGCGGSSSSAPSAPAIIAPTITTSPSSITVAAGSIANFTVVTSGTAPFTYLWSRNGTPIPTAVSASYQLPVAADSDNQASFTVTVTNGAGSATSSAATLTVTPRSTLSITTQPVNQKITAGSTATFSVTATGPGPISYQWFENSKAVGTNACTYTTPVLTSLDTATKFTVNLSCAGTVTSSNQVSVSYDIGIDDLFQSKAGSSTYSPSTPMGVHYANRHVTTAADLVTLLDATIEPPIPPGTNLHLATMPVSLYPSGTPIPADINQHAIGDCDGDSAMACMAYMAPAFIKSIIKDMGDGTFQVSMFDPQGSPVVVAVSSKVLVDGSGSIGAAAGKDGKADWATILEKAAMKYNTIYHVNDDIGGIGSEFMTPLFTGVGNSFAFDRGALTPEEITRLIATSLANGKFITGGFGVVANLGIDKTVTGHGYACFIPPSSSFMLAMRNPWGVNPTTSGSYDATTDGVLNFPPTSNWAQTIDFRIIDPGAAGTGGRTTPYAPAANQIKMERILIAPELLKGGTRP